MKQFASWFTHGVAGGSKLRQQIFQSKTGAAVLQAVDDFFEARLSAGVTLNRAGFV
jgi:tRNA-dihydrouridine synthase B